MTRREFLTVSRRARNEQLLCQVAVILTLAVAVSLWVVGVVLLAEKSS